MEIVTACVTAIVEDVVKSTGRQVGYIFRFKSIIEDLKEEAENLRSAQDDMQHRVDRAIKDTDEIEKKVEKWLKDVTDVVADAEDLDKQTREKKACLNGLCPNLIWRYQMARRAQKKISTMSKLKDYGDKFDNISHRTTLSGINILTPKDFMLFESTTNSFNLIIEALKDDKTNVVGLYGMGGVGKTTLAKAVVKKAKEEKIFNEVVMVVVSQTPNIRDIQDQIADLLNMELHHKSEVGRAERLCMRLKGEKKILIILDDIWEEIDLAIIGIPVDDRHKDCKIFLTTRREQVCIDMGCQPRIPLDVLNKEEGLVLFKRHSGLNDDQSPTKIKLAKEIVEECKGLPLAIAVIGSALKEQHVDEWKTATQKLKKSKLMDVDIVDEKLYAGLKLSYDYLKNEQTKSCFLLCSLFPEDHEIDMEQLLRYGLGLGLYRYTDSIEEARCELRVMVKMLKASSLLIDAEEGYVKMYGVVRDVALRITSKGEEVFMVKAGMGLTEWPKDDGSEQCTAISLMRNHIEVLPDGLVCPKLKILLLDSYLSRKSEVSDEFFEKMKTLKVLSLRDRNLSLNSLQFLMNLVTLQLLYCELRDISSLKKLSKLEILRLKGSSLVELPEELGELSKLRMLDITDCSRLKWIPVNVISKLSRLEELYMGENSFKAWVVEGTSAEQSNASLSNLYRLTILSLCINFQPRLPKDFVFPMKLLRYDIRVNNDDEGASYPKSRLLKIRGIEATSLVAFKALYENVEYLELMEIKGCCQNMVPSIDETGLNELRRLSLESFDELECIVDMTQQQDMPSTAARGGRPPRGFLENLETLHIDSCASMSCLFRSWMLIQSLQKLKKVTVWRCGELEDVFQLEGLCYAKENPFLLSSLESLHLRYLRNLRHIWKGPTQQVRLHSLTIVEVFGCDKLRYLFTLSLARSLLQLEELKVWYCGSLEHIVEIKEAEENVGGGGGNDVMFPKLRKLQLFRLENFINFFDSENYSSTWPALQELSLYLPLNSSTTSFVAQLEANVQISKECLLDGNISTCHLEDLYVQDCPSLTCVLSKHQLSATLVHLSIKKCSKLTNFLLPAVLQYLEIEECPELITLRDQLPEKLGSLKISWCPELESIVERFHNNTDLYEIWVVGCEKLKSIPDGLHTLSSLSDIRISYCANLVSFPEGGFPDTNLRVEIKACEKLKALPKVHTLTSLQQLSLWDCPSLSFPAQGLPTNLESLSIQGHKLYEALEEVGLQNLTSLGNLSICGLPDILSFRVEKILISLPPKLTQLYIGHFPNLKDLSSMGLETLTSLQWLSIHNCPHLKLLPSLPSRLEKHINECPLLEKKK